MSFLKLAQAEGTRAVFKCGTYEVLRTLAEAIEEQKEAFRHDDTLKKACFRNGWTVLRPRVSEGRFVRASEEAWAKELTLGTHRLRDSWVAKRFDHVSEEGIGDDPPVAVWVVEAREPVGEGVDGFDCRHGADRSECPGGEGALRGPA